MSRRRSEGRAHPELGVRDSEKFKLKNLKQRGMLQYFYHSPSSELPIRDVLGENRIRGKSVGKKTEPHIEIEAENYLNDCYQSNIRRFLLSDAKYLFLLTTCKRIEMEEHGNQFIVGYMIKEEWGFGVGRRENSVFVKGPTRLFAFRHALSSKELFGRNLDRPGIRHNLWVDESKTDRILEHLGRSSIPLKKCVQEIKRLDQICVTCYYRNKCAHRDLCLRLT